MSDELPPNPPPDADPPKTGAQARIAELVSERNAIRADLTKAQEQAAAATSLAQELADIKAARTSEQAGWRDERDLLRTGLVDDEAHAVARVLYGRIPEAERPPTIGEWVTGLRAEGATPPPALAGYLGRTGAPVVQPPPPKVQGSGRLPPAAGAVTSEALRAAREHFQKTGDPSRMRALSEAQKVK